jgi:hydroxyacylglutathione hydrolase
MKKWKTKTGYEISQVLSGRSNSFFITTGSYNILIDTGTEREYERLQSNINSLELTNRKIDFLILTHTHFDHCRNAAKIKEEENCRIIVGIKEKESIEKGFTNLPAGTLFITKPISLLGNLIGKKRFGYRPFSADVPVEDELDLINYNLNIKLISTEGHSPGSISIIVDNEIAVVGDAMFGVFKNSVFLPYADNPAGMINSWKKLLDTGCGIFLPGHGNGIKRERLQKEYGKYKSRYTGKIKFK